MRKESTKILLKLRLLQIKLQMMKLLRLLKLEPMLKLKSLERLLKQLLEMLHPLLRRDKIGLIKQREMLS